MVVHIYIWIFTISLIFLFSLISQVTLIKEWEDSWHKQKSVHLLINTFISHLSKPCCFMMAMLHGQIVSRSSSIMQTSSTFLPAYAYVESFLCNHTVTCHARYMYIRICSTRLTTWLILAWFVPSLWIRAKLISLSSSSPSSSFHVVEWLVFGLGCCFT